MNQINQSKFQLEVFRVCSKCWNYFIWCLSVAMSRWNFPTCKFDSVCQCLRLNFSSKLRNREEIARLNELKYIDKCKRWVFWWIFSEICVQSIPDLNGAKLRIVRWGICSMNLCNETDLLRWECELFLVHICACCERRSKAEFFRRNLRCWRRLLAQSETGRWMVPKRFCSALSIKPIKLSHVICQVSLGIQSFLLVNNRLWKTLSGVVWASDLVLDLDLAILIQIRNERKNLWSQYRRGGAECVHQHRARRYWRRFPAKCGTFPGKIRRSEWQSEEECDLSCPSSAP